MCGGRGIRTPGTLSSTSVFKTDVINHLYHSSFISCGSRSRTCVIWLMRPSWIHLQSIPLCWGQYGIRTRGWEEWLFPQSSFAYYSFTPTDPYFPTLRLIWVDFSGNFFSLKNFRSVLPLLKKVNTVLRLDVMSRGYLLPVQFLRLLPLLFSFLEMLSFWMKKIHRKLYI